jgi:hypothetical protein
MARDNARARDGDGSAAESPSLQYLGYALLGVSVGRRNAMMAIVSVCDSWAVEGDGVGVRRAQGAAACAVVQRSSIHGGDQNEETCDGTCDS